MIQIYLGKVSRAHGGWVIPYTAGGESLFPQQHSFTFSSHTYVAQPTYVQLHCHLPPGALTYTKWWQTKPGHLVFIPKWIRRGLRVFLPCCSAFLSAFLPAWVQYHQWRRGCSPSLSHTPSHPGFSPPHHRLFASRWICLTQRQVRKVLKWFIADISEISVTKLMCCEILILRLLSHSSESSACEKFNPTVYCVTVMIFRLSRQLMIV